MLDRPAVPADVVEFGESRRAQPRWRRLLFSAVVLAVLVAAGIGYAANAGHGQPAATPTSHPATPLAHPRPSVSSTPPLDPASPDVKVYDHPLLGETGQWELFGLGTTELVRIGFGAGRITRTYVPRVASSGPLSFLPTPAGAVVRPLDNVRGYLVPDGRPAEPLSGLLGQSGLAYPGPRPGTLWMPEADGDPSHLLLVDARGNAVGGRLDVPAPYEGGQTYPDGSGYLLYVGTGGVYAVGPTGVHRITTGYLLATGPTRWLVRDCDDNAVCSNVVVDKRTGARHTVPQMQLTGNWRTGVISPDGRWAAKIDTQGAGNEVHLADLDAGRETLLPIPTPDTAGDDVLAWSPDSRWLFVVDGNGNLHAVEAATGRDTPLGVPVPPVTHIAVRSAP